MKTGFFETTDYNLSAIRGGIELCPIEDESKSKIQVAENDLVSIVLLREKNSEIEIKTRYQIITGTFLENVDLRDVQNDLKNSISTDVIYVEM